MFNYAEVADTDNPATRITLLIESNFKDGFIPVHNLYIISKVSEVKRLLENEYPRQLRNRSYYLKLQWNQVRLDDDFTLECYGIRDLYILEIEFEDIPTSPPPHSGHQVVLKNTTCICYYVSRISRIVKIDIHLHERTEEISIQKISISALSLQIEGIVIYFQCQPHRCKFDLMWTIHDVKKRLHQRRIVDIPPAHQCIHFKEEIPDDKNRLYECGIKRGSELLVHFKGDHLEILESKLPTPCIKQAKYSERESITKYNQKADKTITFTVVYVPGRHPFEFRIKRNCTVGQLKKQLSNQREIPLHPSDQIVTFHYRSLEDHETLKGCEICNNSIVSVTCKNKKFSKPNKFSYSLKQDVFLLYWKKSQFYATELASDYFITSVSILVSILVSTLPSTVMSTLALVSKFVEKLSEVKSSEAPSDNELNPDDTVNDDSKQINWKWSKRHPTSSEAPSDYELNPDNTEINQSKPMKGRSKTHPTSKKAPYDYKLADIRYSRLMTDFLHKWLEMAARVKEPQFLMALFMFTKANRKVYYYLLSQLEDIKMRLTKVMADIIAEERSMGVEDLEKAHSVLADIKNELFIKLIAYYDRARFRYITMQEILQWRDADKAHYIQNILVPVTNRARITSVMQEVLRPRDNTGKFMTVTNRAHIISMMQEVLQWYDDTGLAVIHSAHFLFGVPAVFRQYYIALGLLDGTDRDLQLKEEWYKVATTVEEAWFWMVYYRKLYGDDSRVVDLHSKLEVIRMRLTKIMPDIKDAHARGEANLVSVKSLENDLSMFMADTNVEYFRSRMEKVNTVVLQKFLDDTERDSNSMIGIDIAYAVLSMVGIDIDIAYFKSKIPDTIRYYEAHGLMTYLVRNWSKVVTSVSEEVQLLTTWLRITTKEDKRMELDILFSHLEDMATTVEEAWFWMVYYRKLYGDDSRVVDLHSKLEVIRMRLTKIMPDIKDAHARGEADLISVKSLENDLSMFMADTNVEYFRSRMEKVNTVVLQKFLDDTERDSNSVIGIDIAYAVLSMVGIDIDIAYFKSKIPDTIRYYEAHGLMTYLVRNWSKVVTSVSEEVQLLTTWLRITTKEDKRMELDILFSHLEDMATTVEEAWFWMVYYRKLYGDDSKVVDLHSKLEVIRMRLTKIMPDIKDAHARGEADLVSVKSLMEKDNTVVLQKFLDDTERDSNSMVGIDIAYIKSKMPDTIRYYEAQLMTYFVRNWSKVMTSVSEELQLLTTWLRITTNEDKRMELDILFSNLEDIKMRLTKVMADIFERERSMGVEDLEKAHSVLADIENELHKFMAGTVHFGYLMLEVKKNASEMEIYAY